MFKKFILIGFLVLIGCSRNYNDYLYCECNESKYQDALWVSCYDDEYYLLPDARSCKVYQDSTWCKLTDSTWVMFYEGEYFKITKRLKENKK